MGGGKMYHPRKASRLLQKHEHLSFNDIFILNPNEILHCEQPSVILHAQPISLLPHRGI